KWCDSLPPNLMPNTQKKARTVPWQNALLLMWALKSAIRRCKFTVAMATSKNTQSSAISETFVFTKFWKVPTKSCV
ncbi:acyl-CoA dehydrogenase, N-terminal domain protein, partial [Vibrio parahaemolyticus VPTS-2010]